MIKITEYVRTEELRARWGDDWQSQLDRYSDEMCARLMRSSLMAFYKNGVDLLFIAVPRNGVAGLSFTSDDEEIDQDAVRLAGWDEHTLRDRLKGFFDQVRDELIDEMCGEPYIRYDEDAGQTIVEDEERDVWFRLGWLASREQVVEVVELLEREIKRGERYGRMKLADDIRRLLGVDAGSGARNV